MSLRDKHVKDAELVTPIRTSDKMANNIYYIVAGTFYTFALSGAVLATTFIAIPTLTLLLYSLYFSVALCVVFYNRYTALTTLTITVCAAVIVFLYLRGSGADAPLYNELKRFIGQLILHIRGELPYIAKYAVLGCALIFAFALLTAANLRSSISFYSLSFIAVACFAIEAYLNYAVATRYLLAFAFCFVLFMTRRMNHMASRDPDVRRVGKSGLTLVPISLIVMLVANMIPKPAAAEQMSISENLMRNLEGIGNYFSDTFSPKFFTLQSTGFARPGGLLGGDVRQGSTFVMEVYTGNKAYLAGAYGATYTGTRWMEPEGERKPLATHHMSPMYDWFQLDNMDSLVAEYSMDFTDMAETGKTLLLVMSQHGPTAEFDAMRIIPGRTTRTVFLPAMALGVGMDAQRGIGVEKNPDGSLYSASALPRGGHYRAMFLAMNTHDDGLSGVLPAMNTDAAAEAEIYLQLPPALPDRVRTLALDITKNAATNYDKIRALEAFLTNFPYTLTPGTPPSGRDFVDYFLFEGQTGYCTYYATALAVMGRCLGIPTRFAQGFSLPDERNARGGYDVTNAQAHAWAEVYFEGFGWIPFEATPAYYAAFYNVQTPQPMPAPDGQSDPFDDMPEIRDILDRAETAVTTAASEPGVDDTGAGASIFGAVVLLIALTSGALFALHRRYASKLLAIDVMDNRQAVSAYFKRIIGTASYLGCNIAPRETAYTFVRRAMSLGLAPNGGVKVAEVFSRARYSAGEISDGDRAYMREQYGDMLGSARGRGPIDGVKFCIQRYILWRF